MFPGQASRRRHPIRSAVSYHSSVYCDANSTFESVGTTINCNAREERAEETSQDG